jgi:hypothetical protein
MGIEETDIRLPREELFDKAEIGALDMGKEVRTVFLGGGIARDKILGSGLHESGWQPGEVVAGGVAETSMVGKRNEETAMSLRYCTEFRHVGNPKRNGRQIQFVRGKSHNRSDS